MSDIRPQPGPQEKACASSADIVIFGGEAGGGKTYWLVLDLLRHHENPKFGGVIFRRTSPQLQGVGSIWEEAQNLYRQVGAKLTESPNLNCEFKSGATIQFLHLQHANDVYDHQGKQYAFIGFDELTHFEESQFWYLISRMRTTCGVKPYMRCTTNPDPDSFVRKLIDWWIGPDGYPIPERDGVLRWFIRDGDSLVWGDFEQELLTKCRPGQQPMSITFIRSRLKDNPALTMRDPGYEGRINSLPEVERLRLGGGNWNVRPEAGKYIKQEYFARRWSKIPESLAIYTTSDYAVSVPRPGHEPDCTEHGVFGIDPNDDIYVLDWWSGQTTSDIWVESLLDKVARWKPYCAFGEAGAIQKAVEPFLRKRMNERRIYVRLEWLSTSTGGESNHAVGYDDPSKRAKAKRGLAFQARAAMGKIIFPANAEWADRVISQCVGFPGGKDDAFDVMGHICRAIDQAHPATSPRPKQEKPLDGWADSKQKKKTDWTTV